jgi:hypothetical protein
MNESKTATLIGPPPYDVIGSCNVWEVEPPIAGSSLVITSTVNNGGGLMGMGENITVTALFPCDQEHEVADWANPTESEEDVHSGHELLHDLGYTTTDSKKTCYQCEKRVNWLAPDSRCGDCTGYTPDEIQGI